MYIYAELETIQASFQLTEPFLIYQQIPFYLTIEWLTHLPAYPLPHKTH